MIVRRARRLGMCAGVRRGLALVEKALRDNPSTPVFTLGELVHNPAVVDEYRARGVTPVDDPRSVSAGVVVIRTHGVDPSTRASCERPGVRCVDATCPKVRRIQKLVEERHRTGWSVIVVGDPGHDEVRGIVGYAPGCRVVATVEEATTVPCGGKTLVVSQTTLARSAYERIAAVLSSRCPGVEIADTTCPSTEERRTALVELASEV
ncbi:MAG TPA: bifunctional 4-hydroxy-3-methylbut-2-enyl diphosphate reductase/30S ribosomal protein S1, partial [Spirochaetia bacterium]